MLTALTKGCIMSGKAGLFRSETAKCTMETVTRTITTVSASTLTATATTFT